MSIPLRCLALLAVTWPSLAVAEAESLAIKTGYWKKSVATEASGRPAGTPMTMEVCMTAEALAFANLSRLVDDTCNWTKRVVTPTRIEVAFTCASMSAESSTEVVDDEHVRVSGTTSLSSGGKLQTISSSETWTFLRSDCPVE